MLPELFLNREKEYDPELEVAFHEAAHGLVQVSFGLLPQYTSLKGFKGTLAFNTASFYVGYDVGVNWKEEGLKYALMLNFAGIVGAASYTGFYNWVQSGSDMEKAEQARLNYNLHFGEYLGIWFDTHALVKEHSDLLEKAAEQLYKDKVLGAEFWEEEILLTI